MLSFIYIRLWWILYINAYSVTALYAFSRSAAWIFFSSSAILFAPILFEVERLQVQSAQLNQQKQVLDDVV